MPKLVSSPAAGLYDFHAGSNGPGGYHGARRSLTNLSELGAEKSPESANRFRAPPESLEAQLSHKLQASCSPHFITILAALLQHEVSVLCERGSPSRVPGCQIVGKSSALGRMGPSRACRSAALR